MGIGELFEFEKTGRIDPENKCYHPKTHYEPWPGGSTIEVCDVCGMSRCHYEWDDSGWVMIKDIPKARKKLQESIDRITSAMHSYDENERTYYGARCPTCGADLRRR